MIDSSSQRPAQVTLAIETAIGQGSLALFRGSSPVALSPPGVEVARAETLLPQIDELLSRAALRLKAIDVIAVSRGPGSYTGIRIGLATAMGLCAASGAEMFGISALEAMLRSCEPNGRTTVAALNSGRSDVVWQIASGDQIHNPEIGSFDAFIESIESIAKPIIIVEKDSPLRSEISNGKQEGEINVLPLENSLAYYIGLAARSPDRASVAEPLYLLNKKRVGGLF
ncbi:MAG: tRNA (adenosine(37)-N6)-threonylcarbamoyltransferase complex dimerization subunit type 1 TsaB [Blastocatellia bacterium]|nr:tRNA (adenosine(37)-N6)-threonylcarbamoyltransferase complex dimerization subunit type 1 TsaB [Blastocatellia bacterium]